MIVVDSNVLAYFWIQGVHTHLAEQVLQKDAAWAAPLLWRSELRNILATYLRRGLLEDDLACSMMLEAEKKMLGHEFSVSSSDVLQMAHASNCSAYDCEFVVLARELNVSLVTADKQVLAAFPKIAMSMSAFVAS